MPEVEGGRWDGLVRKLLNISSPRAMPAVADEMIPTFQVQNWEPELYALRRERLLAGFIDQAAVAGEFPHIGLSNPADSNTLIIVENAEAHSINVVPTVFAFSTELLASLGWFSISYVNRDLRWPGAGAFGNPRASARLVALSSAVAQGVQFLRMISDNIGGRQGPKRWLPVILPPNSGLIYRTDTNVNEQIICNYQWRERPFNPQEFP